MIFPTRLRPLFGNRVLVDLPEGAHVPGEAATGHRYLPSQMPRRVFSSLALLKAEFLIFPGSGVVYTRNNTAPVRRNFGLFGIKLPQNAP